MRCIFFFLALKITIVNIKFHFVTGISEIKKRKNAQLFALIRSTNFVWYSFYKNVYFSFQFRISSRFKNFIFRQNM